MSIYDIELVTIEGEKVSLRKFEGKVLLIVNTASKWGFTPQYEELEALYKKFGNEKFEVLGFPCNQFSNQEPGSNEEINSFTKESFDVGFPMFAKIDVKGPNIHPLYKHLTEEKKGLFGGVIKWNFTKFLVDSSGNVVDRYAPATPPSKIEEKIKELIEK